MKRLIYIIAVLALVTGCVSKTKTVPMPTLTPPVVVQTDPAKNPGSMFDPSRSEFLFDDNRAKRVGDIVLVKVVEENSSKLTADTTANREGTRDFGVTAWPNTGLLAGIPVATDLGVKAGSSMKSTSKSDFTGKGEIKNEATVKATVATRIVRRLPGNILQIEGARRIRVNDETQIVVVKGLIRTSEIASDNTISSTSLAEAHIEIYGQGILTDKQKPGWLARILDNILPF